jgi:hypothetical protein
LVIDQYVQVIHVKQHVPMVVSVGIVIGANCWIFKRPNNAVKLEELGCGVTSGTKIKKSFDER